MIQGVKSVTTVPAKPEPIEIDLAKGAVIVVDMQNTFIRKGGYFDLIGVDLTPTENIIGPCRDVISKARVHGLKIIYLQMAYSADLSDTGPKDSPAFYKSRTLAFVHQHPELMDKLSVSGYWGAEIIEELKPEPGDIVIKKQKYDGFIGTNLDVILKTFGIRYLIFMGTATNICIESTLRRAFFLDYFPILISDAVSQKGPKKLQEATILNVQSSFGWVTNSQNFIKAIEGIKNGFPK
jgi:ureidoacrylate peracid hydrolase